MFAFSRLPYPSQVQSHVLRQRIERGHAGRSIEFLATLNDEEAGVLSYEDRSEKSLGFIYEIFVLPQFRNQGVGSYLLSQAENFAFDKNCSATRLKPYALDNDTDQRRLTAWYTSAGYQPIPGDSEHLEKPLRIHRAVQLKRISHS